MLGGIFAKKYDHLPHCSVVHRPFLGKSLIERSFTSMAEGSIKRGLISGLTSKDFQLARWIHLACKQASIVLGQVLCCRYGTGDKSTCHGEASF